MSGGMPGGSFNAMTEAGSEQWRAIAQADAIYAAGLPDRLLGQLRLLRDERHAFSIDRLEHCLQAASRALHDGRDEEYVVCALLHDVGAALAPADHAEFAAMVLRPFVSERNHWMLRHHGIFQGYYFFHFFGMDRNLRERLRGHPHFDYTAEFCERYDQNAFDPAYPSLPLEAFEPMLRRVLARRQR
jgi:predicted HD phosphohydrolase